MAESPLTVRDWLAVASPRRSELARAILVALVLLAASPFHAPFSYFDHGHGRHAHAQAASASNPIAHHSALESSFGGLVAMPYERTVTRPAASRRPGGRLALRTVLRL